MIYKIALILALTMSTQAAAEPRIFFSQITCNSDKRIPFEYLKEKSGESGMAMGKMVIQDARTKIIHAIDMTLMVNMEAKTFTMIGVFPDGTACIVGSGKDFSRFIPEESI